MTRKVIVWNMAPLDGYFEGPKPWETDWHPLVLGGGTSMFKPSDERMRLKLLEAQPMQSGIVLLRYARS